MRARLLLGWLVGAVLVAGCDTTQPLRQEQQTITLSMRATKANVQEMWLWRVYEDSDLNGLPDDSTGDGVPDEYLWCDPQAAYVSSEMPWSFSVEVDRIASGTTEVVTIAYEIEPNRSFARYDPSTGGLAPPPCRISSSRTGLATAGSTRTSSAIPTTCPPGRFHRPRSARSRSKAAASLPASVAAIPPWLANPTAHRTSARRRVSARATTCW